MPSSVQPHLDYADTVWEDQPGLKSEMEKLQSYQNKFAKKIKLGKMSSLEALSVWIGSLWLEDIFLIDVSP